MSVENRQYPQHTYYRTPAPHPSQMRRWTGAEMLNRVLLIWSCALLLFGFLVLLPGPR